MLMSKNVCTFIACDKDYEEADIVLIGAPFDSTTSYRSGTKFAANQMRIESANAIEPYSVYQDKELDDIAVCDIGDMYLPFGNIESSLDIIKQHFVQILTDKKIPIMIGGEHLVTLGSVRAVAEAYPDLHIVHFDAHADLRDDFFGQKFSHGSVMRRVWDIVGDGKIFQMGIRSGMKEEFTFAKDHLHMCKFNCNDIDMIVEKLQGKPVYITLDLDVLDSSLFPGTGTPEAGGIDFTTLINALIKLGKLNVVAGDINELSPICDPTGASTAVACKVLREFLLALRG